MLKTFQILGVKISNETSEKVSEYVLNRIKNSHEKFFITTPNPEILVYANSHLDYKDKLNKAEVALPDGIGILLAAKLMKISVKERITGVDFIEKLCRDCHDKPISMGFLGGRGGVAEKTAQRLKKKYPWIEIAYVGEEWDDGAKSTEQRAQSKEHGAKNLLPSALSPTLSANMDILFVAYGFPKQEEWIVQNLPRIPVKCAMGVGGSFDYLSGKVARAPKPLQVLGLEWLFRLVSQPWRFKRQLALVTFIKLILKDLNQQKKS